MSSISKVIQAIDDGALPDARRRKALVAATSVMGGIGLLAAASRFEASLGPSEATKARSGPVAAGTLAMRVGSAHTVSRRGKPV